MTYFETSITLLNFWPYLSLNQSSNNSKKNKILVEYFLIIIFFLLTNGFYTAVLGLIALNLYILKQMPRIYLKDSVVELLYKLIKATLIKASFKTPEPKFTLGILAAGVRGGIAFNYHTKRDHIDNITPSRNFFQ